MPPDYDPRTVCLTIDVEWAAPQVLEDLLAILDDRGLRATFFATHAGISVPGHERGIHPNFRRDGDVVKALTSAADGVSLLDEGSFYQRVVAQFMQYAPEARGVRGHSLHYDSQLLPIYQEHGIAYDSSYQMPLVEGIAPFWKEYGILELPIYFSDFFELKSGLLGFDPAGIDLARPGLKIFNIHPNTMYLNESSLAHYYTTKRFYRDPDKLLAARRPGPGIRTMVLGLLDIIAAEAWPTRTLGEVNELFQQGPKWV